MNPVALVVTLGVCVIPSLYAWYNIVANWDPYGNTQGIKIAIANNDRGTQNDLVGELNAGDKVVDQLKENHQLGWTFVDSAADAKEGVESGEYYAAIVIPKNFSDNLVSMLDGNYHQPKLRTTSMRRRAPLRRVPIPVQTPSRSRSTRNLSLQWARLLPVSPRMPVSI